jgi:predicted RNA-binding protein with RPS1 domain
MEYDNEVQLLQKALVNGDVVSFNIEGYDKNKLTGKCNGIYSVLSFYEMPWEYNDFQYWQTIAPYLIENNIKAHILNIVDNPFTVYLSGHKIMYDRYIPVVGDWYDGIILSIKDYGLFIDIGLTCGWSEYSEIGLLHKNYLDAKMSPYSYKVGDKLKVKIESVDEHNDRIAYSLGKDPVPQNEDPLELIDSIAKIKVDKTADGVKIYKIDGYDIDIENALLLDGSGVSAKRMQKLRKKFNKGKVLTLKFTAYKVYKKVYKATWIDAPSPDAVRQKKKMDYFSINRLADKFPFDIGDEIEVTVNYVNEALKLKIDNKYKTKVHILINGRSASMVDKNKVLLGFSDGETFMGIVTDLLRDYVCVDYNL